MILNIGSLGRIIGVSAIVLTAGAAQAQQGGFQLFNPFQPQPAPQPAPATPPPTPQRTQPSPQSAQPAPKKTQAPAQKAQQPSPKAQPAPTANAPFGEVRTACQTELRGTCAGVLPGSADSVQCLQRNFAVHSPACQDALSRARAAAAAQPAAAPAPAKPAGPVGTSNAPRVVSTDRVKPSAAPDEPIKELKIPNMRPTQEARFVNRHCREDHSLLCQGVTFGQGRVLKCLASHQKSLTKDCKAALVAGR